MAHSLARGLVVAVMIGVTSVAATAVRGPAARAADAPPAHDAVTIAINPDGTTLWNGEPLANEPALEARVARRAAQSPKLQLELQFHSVSQLNESNRKTLLDLIELTARYGYVHVENLNGGARLTVLGPSAAETQLAR